MYHTHTKFRGLDFHVIIATIFVGLYFRGVLIFVTIPHISYSKMLSGDMHMFTYLSMISSFIHAIKERHQYTKPSLVMPGRMLIKYRNK